MTSWSRPRRVGYVLKQYPRLSETFVVDEILAVEDAGVEVAIASLRPASDGWCNTDLSRVRACVDYLTFESSALTLEALRGVVDLPVGPEVLEFVDRLPYERRVRVLLQGLVVARWAADRRLDHLHAHFMTVAAHTVYVAHLLTALPFTVTAHAKDVYRKGIDREVWREVAAAATAVVTVCDANRRFLEEVLLAGSPGRVVTIYNGVPVAELGPPPLPVQRDRRTVLAVGRLVEKKGFDVLLAACRILLDRGEDFRCVIVGDGDQREALLAQHRRLHLTDHVVFLGPQPRRQVLDLMRWARVLAAPCRTASDGNRDALPTVLLEALALGLPSVTTPVGGIGEIVEHGGQGLLVPEGDTAAFADALGRLLTDDVAWAACAAACRPRAEDRFDRWRTRDQLVSLLSPPPLPAAKAG